MLEIRPNCEACYKDLPAESVDAYICSYECTFCKDCVTDLLHNVCPNCGGGFQPRPVRPKNQHRPGVSLQQQPVSTKTIRSKYDRDQIAQFAETLKHIQPEDR